MFERAPKPEGAHGCLSGSVVFDVNEQMFA